tara:strand:- start:3523 stop:3831 length:309 start_codon:yes stop_codon:yes gene_type:complete
MPGIARENDTCTTGHGCDTTTSLDGDDASQNVYANDRRVERKGDSTFTHSIGTTVCTPHTDTIKSGSDNVYVNNKSVARMGDDVDVAGNITSGSTNVFVNGD